MENIWVVIAAFNEETVIADVIKGLQRLGYSNIVVVDDGSRDRTAGFAREAGAHVVEHEHNRGQGAALQTGMDYALGRHAGIVVHFDADGQHQPEDIRKFLDKVSEGFDVVLGSRFLRRGSNVPFLRRVFLKGGAFVIWLFYGVKLTDAHNGFRALSRDAAQKIRIECPRMEHASEIIEKIGKYNLKYCEVPVTVKYTDYSMSKGQSNLDAFRILFRMVKNKFKRKKN
jgi:glycosyltransferase involved in cell wall biosynthesis